MFFLLWFLVGGIAVLPLLHFANRLALDSMVKLLGRSLVIAALLYIAFALAWGNFTWLGIEVIGAMAYGSFYWLALRFSRFWLSLGWLLHPVWDLVLHLTGPGHEIVPAWYAVACVSFDIAVAAYIIYRLRTAEAMERG